MGGGGVTEGGVSPTSPLSCRCWPPSSAAPPASWPARCWLCCCSPWPPSVRSRVIRLDANGHGARKDVTHGYSVARRLVTESGSPRNMGGAKSGPRRLSRIGSDMSPDRPPGHMTASCIHGYPADRFLFLLHTSWPNNRCGFTITRYKSGVIHDLKSFCTRK